VVLSNDVLRTQVTKVTWTEESLRPSGFNPMSFS